MLETTQEIKQDQATIFFHGILNEHSNLSNIKLPESNTITFDLQGLTGINSIGTRKWREFAQQISALKAKIIFVHCPCVFVEQLAMFPNLNPFPFKVASFYAPFVCGSCKREQEVLCRVDKSKAIFSARACPHCSGQMNLDDLANETKLIADKFCNEK